MLTEQEEGARIPPDGTFKKHTTCVGLGRDKPLEGAQCTVHVKPLFELTSVPGHTAFPYNCDTVITLGLSDSPFMEKLEKCVQTMRQGEVCLCSWSESNWNGHDVCVNETSWVSGHGYEVEVQVFLKSFTKADEPWRLDVSKKLERAKVQKARGTELFQQGNVDFAFKRFSKALKYLVCIGPTDALIGAQRTDVEALKTVCYLNMSACQLKYSDYDVVIENCTKALALDDSNVKGLYRRAQAYMCTNALDEAEVDLLKAVEKDPTNKAAAALLRKVQVNKLKQDATMASGLAKYFS